MSVQNKRILLVEDDAISAMLGERTLKQFGYLVTKASCGEDAVEIVAQNGNVDLILMDIDLGPGIDGTEAAARILKHHNLPVVFMSSHTEPEIVERTEKITSYGYVVKNTDVTALDASIKMAFKLFIANQELNKSKREIEATLNALPDMLFELGQDGHCYNYHAPRPDLLAARATRPEKLLGKKVAEVLSADPADAIMKALDEAAASGFSFGTQLRLDLEKGSRWFELSVSRKDAPHEQPRFVVISRDITERRELAEAQRLSEEKYRLLFDNSGTTNSVFDTSCRLVLQNRLSREALGDPEDQATGKSVREVFGPTTGAAVEERMLRVMRTGQSETFETVFTLPTGTRCFRSDYQPITDKTGSVVALQVVSIDVTSERQTEERLRDSEAKFRGLVQDMQIGVLLQGPDAEIILSNPAALELLGVSESQLVGKTSFDPDWNVIHEDGSPYPGPDHPVPKAIRTRKPVLDALMGVYRPNTRDRVWLAVDAIPQLNEDGTVRQVVCTFINITKRKEAEENLSVHQIELEMQNDEFLRKQIELEALRAKYFELYDLAPVAYATVNEAGIILEANLVAATQLEIDRHQLIARPFSSFVEHENQDLYYRHRKTMLQSASPESCELNLRSAGGKTFSVRLRSVPAKSEEGKLVFHVSW